MDALHSIMSSQCRVLAQVLCQYYVSIMPSQCRALAQVLCQCYVSIMPSQCRALAQVRRPVILFASQPDIDSFGVGLHDMAW